MTSLASTKTLREFKELLQVSFEDNEESLGRFGTLISRSPLLPAAHPDQITLLPNSMHGR